MNKTAGYKGMLRDRCPLVVNYALKWQKAKERWIDHAYDNFIKVYTSKQEKDHAVRITLGIAKFYREFDFHKSINWDDLTIEETEYWARVESWVKWFRTKYAYMKNAYDISRKCGKDELSIKIEIINGYLGALMPDETDDEEEKQSKYAYVDKLVDFLFKCFEGSI